MRIILDGNAFYEIDEECMKRKERQRTESEKGDSDRRLLHKSSMEKPYRKADHKEE